MKNNSRKRRDKDFEKTAFVFVLIFTHFEMRILILSSSLWIFMTALWRILIWNELRIELLIKNQWNATISIVSIGFVIEQEFNYLGRSPVYSVMKRNFLEKQKQISLRSSALISAPWERRSWTKSMSFPDAAQWSGVLYTYSKKKRHKYPALKQQYLFHCNRNPFLSKYFQD